MIEEIPILEGGILVFPKDSMKIYPLFPNEVPMAIQPLFSKRFILTPFPAVVLLVQIETNFIARNLESTVLTKPQLISIRDLSSMTFDLCGFYLQYLREDIHGAWSKIHEHCPM